MEKKSLQIFKMKLFFSGFLQKVRIIRQCLFFLFASIVTLNASDNKTGMDYHLQEITISGIITDAADGTPLPGVNVVIDGTTKGAISDSEGRYRIDVPSGNTILVFSFVGYNTEKIQVNDRAFIDVQMILNIEQLEEIVVIGYGEQSRARMTTSVSKVDTKVLESVPISNVASALQGTVAGLRVQNNTGSPGYTPTVVMHGGTNWNGSGSPLVIIDGVISTYYALNPEDVESIDVLKDAAATAIYGARAANGVILITTKKGKDGVSKINYSVKYGINKLRDSYEYLNAHDYIYYNRLAVKNYTMVTGRTNYDNNYLHGTSAGFSTGNDYTNPNHAYNCMILTEENQFLLDKGWESMTDPIDPEQEILYKESNMSELFFQQSNTVDHYLSFDGGNEKATYSAGLGYMKNDGIVLKSGFERYTGRLNASYKIRDNIKIGTNILYSHSSLKQPYLTKYVYKDFETIIFQRAGGQPPTSKIYNNNEDGSLTSDYNPGTNVGFGNPLYYQDKFFQDNIEQRLTASLNLDWDITSDLKFSVRGSYFTINGTYEYFNKAYLTAGSLNSTRWAKADYGRTLNNQYNATLNYSKTFAMNHNVNILVGTEFYKTTGFDLIAETQNAPSDFIYTLNAGSEARGVPATTYTGNSIVSQLGRITYDYKAKYLVQMNIRRDGSSKLGNEKYGIFPGFSAGWNIHNENFYNSSSISNVISTIKPRVSYGVNGNVDAISNFEVFGAYGSSQVYDSQLGYTNTALSTLGLCWERSTTFDVGLDLGVANNRVKLLFDYYIRDVYDKIADLTLPYWTGFSSIKTNNGTLRNKGFDLEIKASILRDFRNIDWNIGGTLTSVKNYVVKLPDNENENNRQGGIQIYNPDTQQIEWVGGLQEGKRVGTDEVYAHQQLYIYADQAAVDEHAGRYDDFYPAGGKTDIYPGDVAWLDVDKNDTINIYDQVFMGRINPTVMGGIMTDISFKGFTLFAKADYALGHIIFNKSRSRGLAQVQGAQNSPVEVLDSWTPTNIYTDVARYDFVDPHKNHGAGNRRNSRLYEKGDYLCIREVTLSYDFSLEKIKNQVDNIRVYVSGSNLKYFTEYSGFSPEVGGTDDGTYPQPRVYTFGLNVTF